MTLIGTLGYGAAGVLYALLTVLLATAWRGGRTGAFLIAATLLSAAWGFCLAALVSGAAIPLFLVALVELLRATAWIAFLVRLVSGIGVSRMLSSLALMTCAVAIAGVAYLGLRGSPATVGPDVILIPGGLGIAVLGLVLIEQLYRNSSLQGKWSLKPLVLGVGGIFAFDLFLYAQGLLLDEIDATTWLARGAVNVVFVPMIAIAARRNTGWDMQIFVSRQVVFYSTTLIAAGLYLLLMSLGGYLIVRFGGTWGDFARTVFLAGAAIVLLALLFSTTLRARFKVFLNKHFFHNKYDYREEWLRLVATLGDFDVQAGRHVAIKALAQIVDSPAGAIWVRDDADAGFKLTARYRTDDDFPDFGVDDSIVRFIEKTDWLVDFAEYDARPDRYGDLRLPEWLENEKNAWLLVPLQAQAELRGMILLYKAPGPPRLNYEDRDLLKTVGNHVAVHLAQAQADRKLAEAQQFEAYNRLTAFLMHDLSNLIAQQSLIVTNAEKHKRNPEFVDDAIRTIAGSVGRMKRIMRLLKSDASESSTKTTELRFIVSAAVDRCSVTRPIPALELDGVDAQVAVNAEEFTMVLAHLIRNAQEACEDAGKVDVDVQQTDDAASIIVSDDGVGMSADFIRERLFRPFDSTKGSQGMGIGAYQAREFVRKLGGELTVHSSEGRGTQIVMTVPRSDVTGVAV